MKKLIYPIAAILALITVASFSSDDCRTTCAGKKTVKSHDHQTRTLNNDSKLPELSTVKSQMHQAVAIAGSEPVVYPLAGLENFDSSSKDSDIEIDNQFNREETTIEIPDLVYADEAVTVQFHVENGPVLGYQAKQAGH
ncbi:MAG TPA: hypothetical protein VFX73_01805 [Chitinophagaceae bacterium]|nr:hypothetical protein [Chitinophagaceae bacterium]